MLPTSQVKLKGTLCLRNPYFLHSLEMSNMCLIMFYLWIKRSAKHGVKCRKGCKKPTTPKNKTSFLYYDIWQVRPRMQ
jgi:hypothetical protein